MLRLFGGVHRLVLSGEAPALARHFPSVGGDGDAHAAMEVIREVLAEPPPAVVEALTRPPQTNEVGRSAALASGLLVVAHETGVPLQLREVGASGGLNLRLDSYWYEQDGSAWGRRESPVRFCDLWRGGVPPFSTGAEIVDRRGCDRNPIDPTDPAGALTLLSYVWPEPPERFERARQAMALAAETPVVIDGADVLDWLPAQLADRPPGTALVVFHSVVWQYIDEGTRSAMGHQLDEAGRAATTENPLVWLRLEPRPETYVPAELRLTTWDGNGGPARERLLATTGFHGGPIDWLV